MAYRVELEYRLFMSIDSSLYRPIGLRQYFSEGVQNFVHWHFFKTQYGRHHTQISLNWQ